MARSILYVGQFSFPAGGANALRVHANALALRTAGFDVLVLASGRQQPREAQEIVDPAYREVPFRCAETRSVLGTNRAGRLLSYIASGSRLVKLVHQELALGNVHAVIATAGGQLRHFIPLSRCCEHFGIPLVCDVMDWYEPSHLPFGRFGPLRLEHEVCMRRVFPRIGSIITISRYLEEYFTRNGCATICIPPLVDMSVCKWSRYQLVSTGEVVQLAFVGSAGRKDLLVNAIRGIALLGEDARKIKVDIVGPTRCEVVNSLSEDGHLLDCLTSVLNFIGPLPHNDALRHLMKADFSILLRPDLRFAHAGFPTKLVESMAMGVPVICNLTSDIGTYVHDGQEGLVVPDCSPEAFATGLRRAMALSAEQRTAMRAFARRRAEASFDYRNWSVPLGEFLSQVIENQGRKR